MADQPSGLSPRATIAMLTLKLRAAEQEAQLAEADEKALDHDTMRTELRERLTTMVEERRAYHASAYANAEAKLRADVEAARQAVAQEPAVQPPAAQPAVSQPAARTSHTTASTPLASVPVADRFRIVGEPLEADPAVVPAATPAAATPGVTPAGDSTVAAGAPPSTPATSGATVGHEAPATAESAQWGTAAVTAPSGANIVITGTSPHNAAQPVSIVLDAEVLGKVFAKVFAAMLDERFEAWGRAAITAPPAPAALPPARRQRAVLRHLRQPDVLLLGIASAIVIGVLISWFT